MNKDFDELKKLEDLPQDHLVEWTDEFEKMMVEFECPKCGWSPDCNDNIISYSPKIYSYHLSMLSSFPQYTWYEIHKCPKCSTLFKNEADSI